MLGVLTYINPTNKNKMQITIPPSKKPKFPHGFLKIRLKRFLSRDKLRKLTAQLNKEAVYKH